VKLLALAPGAERSRCGAVGSPDGHLMRCGWSVDGPDEHPVSEPTTRPRLGEDCWSRGLQSALLRYLLRWGVSHWWRLPGLMHTASPTWLDLCNQPLHALRWAS